MFAFLLYEDSDASSVSFYRVSSVRFFCRCRQLPSDLCRCQWTIPGPRSWAWSGKLDLHGMESLSFNVTMFFKPFKGIFMSLPADFRYTRKPANFISSISDDRGEDSLRCRPFWFILCVYTWLHNVTYIWHILTYPNDLNVEKAANLCFQHWTELTSDDIGNVNQFPGAHLLWHVYLRCLHEGLHPSIRKMSRLTKTSTRFQDIGIGGVLSLLWFRRQLPDGISEHLLKDLIDLAFWHITEIMKGMH